jgi:hypothetical protein
MLAMINDSSYTDLVTEWLRLLKDTVDVIGINCHEALVRS